MVIHVMKGSKGEKRLKPRIAPLIIALLMVQAVHVSATPSPTTLSFELFTDGSVRVDYGVAVDPTSAQENITLFGELVQDLFVYDEEGLLLGSDLVGDYLLVDTLGASSIDISYLTSDLTNKNGAIWSIDVTTPVSTDITLPLSSTIINLNEIPLEIDTVDDQTRLVMPAGQIVVSYTIDIKDSKTIAEEEIAEAQRIIEEVKEIGTVVPEPEELLAEAIAAYENEDFIIAYEKAFDAGDLAGETGAIYGLILNEIEGVREEIQKAEDAGRTIGLDNAKELLDETEDYFAEGDYTNAINIVESAKTAAQFASKPETQDNTPVFIGAGIAVVAVAAILYQRRTQTTAPVEHEIDLERLFDEHPELRLDDKEALRFMVEHGGEAFAHEVRERFDIPRTSAWRMVQRLQRFEVIEERKIGGQSLLSIVEEYRRRKQ